MKHKTLRYRRNLSRLGRKSIGRKRNSILRTKNTKRLRRRHTRKYKMRGYKMRGYKMRGGEVVITQAPMPPAVFTPAPQIVAGNPADGIKAIEAQRVEQNMANKMATKMGGGNGNKKKQRGGTATICGGAPVNGGDGYGYTPPNNCLLVPTVNNAAAQAHAINTMDTLNTLKANAAGDGLVGVLPK